MDGRAVFGAHTAWDLHGLGGSREASVCQHLLGREGGSSLLSCICSWWPLALVPECRGMLPCCSG